MVSGTLEPHHTLSQSPPLSCTAFPGHMSWGYPTMSPALELWTPLEGRGLHSNLLFPLAPAFPPSASLRSPSQPLRLDPEPQP